MVLTDRQRADLHAGIYEYLTTLPDFAEAAAAFAKADPAAAASVVTPTNGQKVKIPLLEKKWTAIPRLQKKVLELERIASQSNAIHAHRAVPGEAGSRRRLPRLPCTHTLQGHAGSVTCVALHPVYTMVVSGSEDGTIKVRLYQCRDRSSSEALLGSLTFFFSTFPFHQTQSSFS